MRNDIEVIQLVEDNLSVHKDIAESRVNNRLLEALVYGHDFSDVLISQIEKLENKDRAAARKKYSLDIRDLNKRIMSPRSNVFTADGGSENWADINDARKEAIKKHFDNFKGGKSIFNYLEAELFQLSDVDPNGLIFLEYKSDNDNIKELYPTYKHIKDIQNYEPNGIKLNWVLFAPITIYGGSGKTYKEWRYVDSERDVFVKDFGGRYAIDEEKTKANDFKEVPATILSNIEKIGTKVRYSSLFFVTELYKKYAQDSSIKYIYEKLQGFPKHWRYASLCRSCHGTGQRDGEGCTVCDSKGQIGSQDVTDDIVLNLPTDKENDAIVAPNIAGFLQPDLESLKHFEESLKLQEETAEKTIWGVYKEKNKSGAETATGRSIDVQPIVNQLKSFSSFAQTTHNHLATFVINLVDRLRFDLDDTLYNIVYPTNFILESPYVLSEKYGEAKKNGLPITILDKLLSELIMSKYKSDPKMRSLIIKKSKVEPLVHMGIKEIFDIFGSEKAEQKTMFADWWDNEADKNKTEKELIQDYKLYFENNKTLIKTEIEDGE